jgi:hypothetical protein
MTSFALFYLIGLVSLVYLPTKYGLPSKVVRPFPGLRASETYANWAALFRYKLPKIAHLPFFLSHDNSRAHMESIFFMLFFLLPRQMKWKEFSL